MAHSTTKPGSCANQQQGPQRPHPSPVQPPHLPTPQPRVLSPTFCNHRQVLFGVNQRLRVEDVDSPLAAQRPVKAVALVVVTGDRGLCGGYNK